jgi:hypothetical protein
VGFLKSFAPSTVIAGQKNEIVQVAIRQRNKTDAIFRASSTIDGLSMLPFSIFGAEQSMEQRYWPAYAQMPPERYEMTALKRKQTGGHPR